MFLRQISDPRLSQYAYLIGCQRTGEAIVVDPERDVERYQRIAAENDLKLTAVTETHIHADFVSGALALVESGGVHAYLSAEGGADWQSEWARGRKDVTLVHDGDHFYVGRIRFDVRHLPGHTPEHICFVVTDEGGGATEPMALLSGDFLFVGDAGRPDLLETAAGVAGTQEQGAQHLYASLRRLDDLPDYLQVLPAHGAGSACGKALGAVPSSTLGYERRFNPTLRLALQGGAGDFSASILTGQPEPPLYFAEMKRVNRVGPAVTAPPAQPPPAWNLDEAIAAAERGEIVIVDTRAPADFLEGHVAGSLYAPARGNFSDSAGSYLAPANHIVLVAEREAVACEAMLELFRIGFDHVVAWVPAAELRNASGARAKVERVRFTEVGSWLVRHPGSRVLDVRRASEFATGHLRGAANIAHTRLRARLRDVPDAPFVLVHCQSGARAVPAIAFLRRSGRQAALIEGSFNNAPRELVEGA